MDPKNATTYKGVSQAERDPQNPTDAAYHGGNDEIVIPTHVPMRYPHKHAQQDQNQSDRESHP